MNQIIKQNRLFTSITKGKNRNKSKLHPRSSSVTVSQIRLKKNKINNENDLNHMPLLSVNNNYINRNITLFNNKEREIKSERKSININNELNNKNLFKSMDIFIEKDLMKEEIIDEKNKIKSMLNNLIFWENEHLLERKEKEKTTQNKLFMVKINKQRTNSKNDRRINKSIINIGKGKTLSLKLSERLASDRNNSLKLKYDILEPNDNKNNSINKVKFDYDITKEKEIQSLVTSEKDRKHLENTKKEELKQINQKILLNKYKKKQYNDVLNSTYHLLDKARTEYNLSVDILQKRIESTQKYYEAIIKDYEIQHHFKRDEKRQLSKSMRSIEIPNTIYNNIKKNKNKINNLELYEAKMRSYRDYLSIVEDINNEIKKYDINFNNIQKELNELIIKINEKLCELNLDTSELKAIFKDLSYQESQYYLSLLKFGRDTRKDGLSWIIKRLMELNIPITHNIFPKFLDKEHINYLIKIGKLEYEKTQIKSIIEALKEMGKNKKKLEKSKSVNDNMTSNKENYYKNFNFNNDILDEDIYNNFYGSKVIDKLMELYNKQYIMKNKLYIYKKQNNLDNLVLKEIKKKINIFARNKDDKIFNEENIKNNIKNVINVSIKGKEQYYNILVLREKEKKLNWYIRNLRKKQILIFQEKYRPVEIKDIVSKMNYQKMFNALFGKNDFD